MKLANTKVDVIKQGIELLDQYMSNACSNDFTVCNTPELMALAEEYTAWNLSMTVEEFKARYDYEDEKPSVSKDGTKIYMHDSFILYILKKELVSK